MALAYSFITDLIGLGYYFGRKDTSLLHSGKNNDILVLCDLRMYLESLTQ